MSDGSDAARRLEELEVRTSYQDRLIAELSDELYERSQRLERLEAQMARLVAVVRELAPNAQGALPAGERPPHY